MPFDLEIQNPVQGGYTGWAGGPNVGGHTNNGWTVRYGHDLSCPVGTPVYSAFDSVIHYYYPNKLDVHEGKIYGAQITVKSKNDQVWGFYTHVNQLDAGIANGKSLARGAPIGKITNSKDAGVHLHFAMAEKVGTDMAGVDLSALLKKTANTPDVNTVRFFGDGKTPPAVQTPAPAAPVPAAPPSSDAGASPQAPLSDGGAPPTTTTACDAGCPAVDAHVSAVANGSIPVPQDGGIADPLDGGAPLARMPRRPISPAEALALQRAIGNRATTAALGTRLPGLGAAARAARTADVASAPRPSADVGQRLR